MDLIYFHWDISEEQAAAGTQAMDLRWNVQLRWTWEGVLEYVTITTTITAYSKYSQTLPIGLFQMNELYICK